MSHRDCWPVIYADMSRCDEWPVVIDDVGCPLWSAQGLKFESYDYPSDNPTSKFNPEHDEDDDDTVSVQSQCDEGWAAPHDSSSKNGFDVVRNSVFNLRPSVTTMVCPQFAHLTTDALCKRELELRRSRTLRTTNKNPQTVVAVADAAEDDGMERDVSTRSRT